MSISRDLEIYRGTFGNEKIVYSHTITFIFTDKDKERSLISSIFLTSEHITVINTRNNLKYRIPLGDIKDISTDRGVLKYYVHLRYGNQYYDYKASIDFTNKNDGQAFISLLSLAVEVDRKRLELKTKEDNLKNTYENEIAKIQEYKENELKNINEEKEKIINNMSNLKKKTKNSKKT